MNPLKYSLLILFIVLLPEAINAKTSDFDIIKKRVVAELLKTPVDDMEVGSIIQRMNEDGSFKGIDYNYGMHTNSMISFLFNLL